MTPKMWENDKDWEYREDFASRVSFKRQMRRSFDRDLFINVNNHNQCEKSQDNTVL